MDQFSSDIREMVEKNDLKHPLQGLAYGMPIFIKTSLEHGDETLGSCYTHEVGLRRL